ncbi:MAG: hypothetical protein HZA08_09555 [Nitrospirae bacterium]|nr:hypothetical protein [Nitrospirota bacterium]
MGNYKPKNISDDFLGLVTFGSLIANILQIVKQKRLEDQHQNLKAYADNLKHHYDNMIGRYEQVSSAYLSMKSVNTALYKEIQTLNDVVAELYKENNRLIKELDTFKKENLKLKTSMSGSPVKKKRRVVKREKNA